MSHGKRNQYEFRKGSLKRKISHQQREDARFDAQTRRLINKAMKMKAEQETGKTETE